jgi:hypothetical protein
MISFLLIKNAGMVLGVSAKLDSDGETNVEKIRRCAVRDSYVRWIGPGEVAGKSLPDLCAFSYLLRGSGQTNLCMPRR